MSKRKNVCVVFGGQSGEYYVSLQSACTIIKSIDKEKYDISAIGITLDGRWYFYNGDPEKIRDNTWLDDKIHLNENVDFFTNTKMNDVDIFFPIIHGQTGEDGKLQGLFEILGKPYVGCDVTSSAVCMDKDLTKRILSTEDIPVVEGLCIYETDLATEETFIKTLSHIERKLRFPVFIKPANMGSSVGISKANNKKELAKSLINAIRFDRKVLIEKAVNAREVEIAVLGNNSPKVTLPGEIIPCNEFYDYEAKYLSGDSSKINIPADIGELNIGRIQKYALKAYKLLGCSGLARIDFFISKDSGEIYLNEINTLPGFTNISMYAKMWEEMGISYKTLIDKLINLGFQVYERKQKRAIKE